MSDNQISPAEAANCESIPQEKIEALDLDAFLEASDRLRECLREQDRLLGELAMAIAIRKLHPWDPEKGSVRQLCFGPPGGVQIKFVQDGGEEKIYDFLELPMILQEHYAKVFKITELQATGKGRNWPKKPFDPKTYAEKLGAKAS